MSQKEIKTRRSQAKVTSNFIFHTHYTDKGLPGKSFLYILEIDKYLRMALSLLSPAIYFDLFVASCITYRFKQKHRKQSLDNFLNYMCVYDESRVDYILTCQFITRSKWFEFLSLVAKTFSKVDECIGSEEETCTAYLFSLKKRWGPNFWLIHKNIQDLHERVTHYQDILVRHYLRHIIGKLMSRRKGENNPKLLTSDAYLVMLEMIDKYDPERSKIPFSNFLKFFISAGKNKVIKTETWGLRDGAIVSLDSLSENTSEQECFEQKLTQMTDPTFDNGHSFSEEYALVEEAFDSLPLPLANILSLNFGLIDPLTPEQEVRLLLNSK